MELTTIDHFVLGINDLEKGIEEFTQTTGIAPIFGGVHEKVGTHNALVSLGESAYLEILAPLDKDADVNSIFGNLDKELLTPVGWVMGTTNSDNIITILESHDIKSSGKMPLSRKTSEGNEIKWTNIFHQFDGKPSVNPFFIEWEDLAKHPSKTTPAGCTLESFVINSRGEDQLTAFLKAMPMELTFQENQTLDSGYILSIVLHTPKGQVKFEVSQHPL